MASWWSSWFKRGPKITLELTADDIVVFVVGPSGGGKTWFVEAVTNSGYFEVSTNLKPSTKEVQAVKCELTDDAKNELQWASEGHKNIVFVDTPSLLNGAQNEKKAEKNTRRWLIASKSKSTLGGIIYIDDVAHIRDRENTPIREYLKCFARTFPSPQEFKSPPLRLRGALSYNPGKDRLDEEKIKSRVEIFGQRLGAVDSVRFEGRRNSEWDTSSDVECLRGERQAWKVVVGLFSE